MKHDTWRLPPKRGDGKSAGQATRNRARGLIARTNALKKYFHLCAEEVFSLMPATFILLPLRHD
jgi:hypothetical protein